MRVDFSSTDNQSLHPSFLFFPFILFFLLLSHLLLSFAFFLLFLSLPPSLPLPSLLSFYWAIYIEGILCTKPYVLELVTSETVINQTFSTYKWYSLVRETVVVIECDEFWKKIKRIMKTLEGTAFKKGQKLEGKMVIWGTKRCPLR